MIKLDKLWVGSINGFHAVFDPEIQVEESRWVLLYIINRETVVPYRRLIARAEAKKHQPDHPEFNSNIEKYLNWRNAKTTEEIEELKRDVRHKDTVAQNEIARIKTLHQKYLSIDDEAYLGVSEPTSGSNIRDSVCFNCHNKVSSHLNLRCKACGWMICGQCGFCGCHHFDCF